MAGLLCLVQILSLETLMEKNRTEARPKKKTNAGSGVEEKALGTWLVICCHLWSLVGLKRCLWVQGTRALRLRSLMPIQERDEGDSERLKVTPSQRLPYPLFEVDLLFPQHSLSIPSTEHLWKWFCMFTCFLFKSLSPPKSKSPACLAHH